MANALERNSRKSSGARSVSTIAIRTLSVNESIAEALKGWSAKLIARRVKTSLRTVENWKQAKTGPQVKHIAAMLNDDELCAAVLTAFGRADLATRAKMQALLEQALESDK